MSEITDHPEVKKAYQELLENLNGSVNGGVEEVERAFYYAAEAHQGTKRLSGKPYIYHPLQVALIATGELGLGHEAAICALLHDVVEDTDVKLEDIQQEFGEKTAAIIQGLTKIAGLKIDRLDQQSENFRKLLLTLSDDVRVILIKLADRLHNMRTLDAMPREKQVHIALETHRLYSPLAHRLGLYRLKSEMEDLSLKFIHPEDFKMIAQRLDETENKRDEYITEFIKPIAPRLEDEGLKYTIKSRTKSIHSIWAKMKKQNIPFERIFDLFAIRITLDSKESHEKPDCWRAYSVVTDHYQPNPKRLRDWISIPKSNGYESLHTTVMGPEGNWVEVQIRSRRMDEIAEKGLAAHWRYKGGNEEKGFERWLKSIREIIENPDLNSREFLTELKMDLYTDEIFLFTPRGDLKRLPAGATVLDFAFSIHTDIGATCTGARVNNKAVPIKYVLHNGDQVEIMTSKNQTPSMDWLNYVITSGARARIRKHLNEEKLREAEHGKELLERRLKNWKLSFSDEVIQKLQKHFKMKNSLDLYYDIALEKISMTTVKDILFPADNKEVVVKDKSIPEKIEETAKGNSADILVIGKDLKNVNYKLARCCNPIYGDKVFGFISVYEGIKIHRMDCPNAGQLLARYPYRIISASWRKTSEQSYFYASIKISGLDRGGLVQEISELVSNIMKVDLKSIQISAKGEKFEGKLSVLVRNKDHLGILIRKLLNIKGIEKARRLNIQ